MHLKRKMELNGEHLYIRKESNLCFDNQKESDTTKESNKNSDTKTENIKIHRED